QVHRLAADVFQFNPVGILAILIRQGLRIAGHELGDDDIAALSGEGGEQSSEKAQRRDRDESEPFGGKLHTENVMYYRSGGGRPDGFEQICLRRLQDASVA